MILFFDTETTGFFQDRLPYDHPDQPRLVQLAAQLTDDAGLALSSISLIVNPGIPIPERASAVHGITNEIAEKVGISENTAIGIFAFMARRSAVMVAHNSKFDVGVMECVRARTSIPLELPEAFCTMEKASPIINLPPTDRMRAAGIIKPKPPKLEECIRHFFGEDLEGAHDAMVDLVACRRVYFHLKSLEMAA
jgi:DNA polymerase III subunit epsilon